jgi:hypothetical protein
MREAAFPSRRIFDGKLTPSARPNTIRLRNSPPLCKHVSFHALGILISSNHATSLTMFRGPELFFFVTYVKIYLDAGPQPGDGHSAFYSG